MYNATIKIILSLPEQYNEKKNILAIKIILKLFLIISILSQFKMGFELIRIF